MSNNGLKYLNEVISHKINDTEIICNVTEHHGNVVLKMNEMGSNSPDDIPFFLYYSIYNDDTTTEFGKGVYCNYYQRIEEIYISYIRT